MSKESILDEIRRTAAANDGVPLGRDRFQDETGIKQSDWYGKYWRNWGEAITEAGFKPNQFRQAYQDDLVISKLVELIREQKSFPVNADLRMKARLDPEFPSHTVFARIGSKSERARKVIEYCRLQEGFDDVIAICQPFVATAIKEDTPSECPTGNEGIVYLLKSGRYYKIGRTNSIGRRTYELAIQLPERASLVHQIKTDDPVGIEEYWHKRFRDERRNGEWFELSAANIAAFKRRRFM